MLQERHRPLRQKDEDSRTPAQRSVSAALAASYSMLGGTIHDYGTHQCRAFVPFFGCEQDLFREPPDGPKPDLTPDFLLGSFASLPPSTSREE